jgi:hypothetical protein
MVSENLSAGRDSGVQRVHVQVATLFDLTILREVTAVHWRAAFEPNYEICDMTMSDV